LTDPYMFMAAGFGQQKHGTLVYLLYLEMENVNVISC